MKILDIALKDLLRSLRTPFALIMMFGAPLLITGLLYFAFGSLAGGADLELQPVRVQVANLDRPDAAGASVAAGQKLVSFLQSPDLSTLLLVTAAGDEASARAAVDGRRADVALIIPPNFSAAVLSPDEEAVVVQYQDPTLAIGPGIVEDLVSQFIDGFAGAKITAAVVSQQLSARGVPAGDAVARKAAMEYAAWLDSAGHDHGGGTASVIQSRSPAAESGSSGSGREGIGAIMAGMTIFFAFFMGANSAESIIREDEEGTLQRLFTTPTSQAAILGGKFGAVVLILVIQVVILLVASSLIFGIHWGRPLTIVLVTLGLITAAAGFGVFLMSTLKSTRQTGPVLGGVMTLTGMLGGLFTTGMPDIPQALRTARLAVPQGWAMYSWELALDGGAAGEVLLPVLVMLALGALFFGLGVVLFRRRFA